MSEFENRDGRYRRWMWVFMLLAVVTLAFGLWVWVFQPGRVRAELERIRAAGEPVTVEELAEMYPTPAEQEDATQRWLDAFAAVGAAVEQTDPGVYNALPYVGRGPEIPLPGEPWPEQGDVENFLAEHAESLRLLHEAAGHGGAARFPVDFRQGVNVPLLHVNELRSAARFLVLEAEVDAHTGNAGGAAEAVRAMFAAARSVENEPMLVSQLVRSAVETMTIREIERLLPAVEFADADLEQWQEELRRADYRSGMCRAMMAERVFGKMVREDPASYGVRGASNVAARLWGSADLVFYLQLMGRMVDAGKKPWPEALESAAAVEAEVAALRDPRYVLTKVMLPSIGRSYSAAARTTALNRACDAGLAVELYRRRGGTLPESLKALVPEFLPEVPTDPFDGKPLRYVVSDGDYAVYSVGADGKDDGGQGDLTGKPDVVFRVGVADGDAATSDAREGTP
jgi:hypothetical protein